jgi:hypothetical protein
VNEYLATLDDAAYGAAFFAYADNYLIDVKFGIVMASRAVRQAEVRASRTMIKRTEACFGIKPEWLVGDTAYGSAPNFEATQVVPKFVSPSDPAAQWTGAMKSGSSTSRKSLPTFR